MNDNRLQMFFYFLKVKLKNYENILNFEYSVLPPVSVLKTVIVEKELIYCSNESRNK